MIKRVLLAGLLTLVLGVSTMKAQDSYLSNDRITQIQKEQDVSLSSITTERNKLAVALQIPYNGNKLGAGFRFSYDFTSILRFSFDGSYYFHTKNINRFNTIDASGNIGTDAWGRTFDFNANLNFVYGDKNFHFYLITGLYFSMANGELLTLWVEDSYTYMEPDFKTKYYYTDKIVERIGLGFNVGCGVEYQINNCLRIFFEQQASLGILSSWMAKTGVAFCF